MFGCATQLMVDSETVVTCVFQSFYLSDWQGGCAFGGQVAIISASSLI